MIQPRMPLLLAAAAVAMLSGCASKEERVRSALVDIGLGERSATCLAPPLARDLSTDELRKIGRMAQLRERDVRTLSISALVDRLGPLGDPHIVRVVARAALDCALTY